jgi:serine/threonine protein kinase
LFDRTNQEELIILTQKQLEKPQEIKDNEEVWNLLKGLLEIEPIKRLSASSALKSSIFTTCWSCVGKSLCSFFFFLFLFIELNREGEENDELHYQAFFNTEDGFFK